MNVTGDRSTDGVRAYKSVGEEQYKDVLQVSNQDRRYNLIILQHKKMLLQMGLQL